MTFRESRRLEAAIASLRRDSLSPALTDENRARLAQLLAVWVFGYLEASCREALLLYTKKRAHPNVVRFVRRKLDRFGSPKVQNIVEEIRIFDEKAADDVEHFAEGRIKESVNSIVAIRHAIAHGRSSSVSMARVEGYADDARKLMRRVRSVLNVDGER